MSTGRFHAFSTDKSHAHSTYRYHTHSTDMCHTHSITQPYGNQVQKERKENQVWRRTKKTLPPSPSNPLPTNVSPAKTTQKSGIKATSTGLPVPPPTTPKLEKATPYEFLQVSNSLKNVTEIQPYAGLLKQIPPKDLLWVRFS